MKNRVSVSTSDKIFYASMAILVLVAMIFFIWFDFTQMSRPGLWLVSVLGLLPFLIGSILAMVGILEISGQLFPSIKIPTLKLPRRKGKNPPSADDSAAAPAA